MVAVSYSDNDLWTKEQFEKLFWIEVAKRKAKIKEPDGVRQLNALVEQINVFFDVEGRELEEPVEDGAYAVLRAVEFDLSFAGRGAEPEQISLLEQARFRFESDVHNVESLLSYHRGFSLADFSLETDLRVLSEFWTFISSTRGRIHLGTETSQFSTHGEARYKAWSDDCDALVDTPVQTITTLSWPVSVPNIVHNHRFFCGTTDEYEVAVDTTTLESQVVLAFDLNQPLPPMHLIEGRLRSAYELARAHRNWEMLNSGQVPEDLLNPKEKKSSFDVHRLLSMKPDEHRLMKGPASPGPLIVGLHCWDLKMNEKLSDTAACRKAVEELFDAQDEESFESRVRRAKHALSKVVRPLIEDYDPDQLPWLNWSS
ncbi:hypothetical protein M1M11_08145 [Pseudomonas azerbaijanoccidens]|uniref:hypothetical protein n=1 Tax=Pseudomonas azerbaijanoccidentalis TaxID=2842347 RepID=UPI00200A7EE6|nr:hypothetical protein [Pseudomonas azerbaijanoccidentalis]MCK8664853.1 hypothetical protein [Pseudomonas azerbaijanoccidentalis]